MGRQSLEGYSPWGRKESDTTEGLTLDDRTVGRGGKQAGRPLPTSSHVLPLSVCVKTFCLLLRLVFQVRLDDPR